MLQLKNMKQCFYNTFQKSILKVKKEHPGFKLIVGADMNATVATILMAPGLTWAPTMTPFPLMTMGRGFFLCLKNAICTYKTLFTIRTNPSSHLVSSTGFSKRVDYILADWHIKKLSTNCRVYRKASIPFESDHRLLVLHCSFPSKSEQKKFFRKPLTKKPFTKISC